MDDMTKTIRTSLEASFTKDQESEEVDRSLDEEKSLLFIRSNGENSVAVVEKTVGPLTREIYQTNTHLHGVVINRAALKMILGVPDNSPINLSLVEEEMTQQEVKLVDLLDELDQKRVRYTYFAENGNDIVWRPAKN